MAARMTSDERRTDILNAALAEFAEHGYSASTEAVATRAGISQPYLFKLFPTKQALYLAVVAFGFGNLEREFLAAARGMTGLDALHAMGQVYLEIADHRVVAAQLQAYSGVADPVVTAAVREAQRRLWQTIAAATGADEVEIAQFFACGLMISVGVSLELPEFIDNLWLRRSLGAQPPSAQETEAE